MLGKLLTVHLIFAGIDLCPPTIPGDLTAVQVLPSGPMASPAEGPSNGAHSPAGHGCVLAASPADSANGGSKEIPGAEKEGLSGADDEERQGMECVTIR